MPEANEKVSDGTERCRACLERRPIGDGGLCVSCYDDSMEAGRDV